ncbi:MAG: peptide-methionine (S)-S-oxide reductase MsrA [Flavobacteriaceae bacterium]|nr:peptide-methionine (S)-S-oxide reductase MsrA [Flavobacteriaceae bacterium]
MNTSTQQTETVTLGAGCFWCVEAVFDQLKGVEKVQSGYSGGTAENPSYEEVCTGTTGHAEVVQITYNPQIIAFEDILEVFWTIHDPTTLNRQGADVGTQYRSAIFYHNEKQRKIATAYIQQLNDLKTFEMPIVTEVTPFSNFYPAENYHDNYYNQNGDNPYCRMVIRPKVRKFQKLFEGKLKE